MVSESTLLKYFYKQNRAITLDDLFEKYGVHDSILKPVNFLIDNDWLMEYQNDANCWIITDEGRHEQELRDKSRQPPPSTYIIGDKNVVGNNQSSFENSFNADINKSTPAKSKSIDWEKLLKIIGGIILIILAVLKFFGLL